ncbi:DNA repair protein RecN [Lutispora thermophila]|uniref:DNA repair protein RecN n=1 Tax=Lutispora thermophila DSM 19022 TaxID=1122184 RepID=A0A1M6F5Z3_9FIRM|nr:DNA repair protein RecN [Lutispora thermophila]SHI93125.1 DNA repair protein RecN (Recombination protein N) [Lutispora thermophila DSM 19022]
MLQELFIKNYIIFNEERVVFTEGFNVITGETGSGKSVIIDAIEVLCGGKFSKDDIKTGADKAIIQGLFIIPNNLSDINERLLNIGVSPEEDKTLLIQREITSTGRSLCRINGQAVTLTMLKSIAPLLIDIVAQNEHQLLFKPTMHIKFLDSFGSETFLNKLNELSVIVDDILNLEDKLQQLYGTSQERERKLDLLKYQIDEINNASLNTGEYEKLINRKKILNNSEKLLNTISSVYGDLFHGYGGSKSVLDILGNSLQSLEDLTRVDEKLIDLKDHIAEIYYKLEDLKNPIRQYKDNIEFNSGEIEAIEERLELIDKLMRKYGTTIDKIIEYRNEAIIEYNNLLNNDKIVKEYENKISLLKEKYFETACEISNIRQELARMLENKVEKELKDLNMVGARFIVDLKNNPERISKEGIDRIEFMLSANPGEPEKPLIKVASGGEVSRVMLAIKSVLSEYQNNDIIIFDEIDAGIGGHTANIVGEKLYNISKRIQTICITHLPQIACFADNHICVRKHIEGNKTYSEITSLNDDERISEIVKMIAFDDDLDFSINMAKELLNSKKAL